MRVPCVGGGTFSIAVRRVVVRRRSAFQEMAVYDTGCFGKCLVLDGLIQSSERDHHVYDKAALKSLTPRDRSVLILGGGDGYVAATALESNGSLKVTVVELDAEVVRVSREFLGQQVLDDPRVVVFIEDALDFLRRSPGGAFDGVVCDLTDFPLGQGDDRFQLFYADVFSLLRGVMKKGAWISVYSGSKDATVSGGVRVADLMTGILEREFCSLDTTEVYVPSFGEASCFIHGKLAGGPASGTAGDKPGARKEKGTLQRADAGLPQGVVAPRTPSGRPPRGKARQRIIKAER